MSNGKLSILSGYLKSRQINYLEDDNIRPTKTYIREVIFNVCEIHSDFNTLDLFCGSGILSLESISRGVNKAYLVDNNREVCKMISSEFTKLNVKNYEMFNMDVTKFVQMNPEINFDIIFIDPPYKYNNLRDIMLSLQSSNIFQENRYIYFEQHKKNKDSTISEILIDDYEMVKDLSIGEVSYTIAKKRIK